MIVSFGPCRGLIFGYLPRPLLSLPILSSRCGRDPATRTLCTLTDRLLRTARWFVFMGAGFGRSISHVATSSLLSGWSAWPLTLITLGSADHSSSIRASTVAPRSVPISPSPWKTACPGPILAGHTCVYWTILDPKPIWRLSAHSRRQNPNGIAIGNLWPRLFRWESSTADQASASTARVRSCEVL